MNSDSYTGKPAGFWIRFLAQCEDVLYIVLIFILSFLLFIWVLRMLIGEVDSYVSVGLGPLFWLGYFLFVAGTYYSWMTSHRGQTVGKRVFNLLVVGREGRTIGFGQSLTRFFCYFLSFVPFFIGFILPAFNREKKALHDYVSGTKVIYTGQPSTQAIVRVSITTSLVVLFVTFVTMIILAKFVGMLEKSREGATKGNQGQIKEEILKYHSQNGTWPQTLDNPLPVKVTGKYVSGSKSPAGKKITMAQKGAVPTTSGKGWLYDSNSGSIYVNSTVKDSKSIAYSFYGFE
jgi:uncharacterized RDD family membrane protein YckC